MQPITTLRILIIAYLFALACFAGASNSIVLLFIAIYGSYFYLRVFPVFKDKPTKRSK